MQPFLRLLRIGGHDKSSGRRSARRHKQVAMIQRPFLAAAAALLLSGCTASLASFSASSFSGGSARELSAEEKKVIMDSVAETIRDPAKARYLWAKFPAGAPSNGQAHYCAAVDAKSPHAPYNGLQPYIVLVQTANGQVVSAVVGAIAGGKDTHIVRNLCTKQGLNPDEAV
jgi:hypothetical protein